MRASAAEVLREAARDVHPNESFEKALSRSIQKHQGTYEDYMDLVGDVRERARKDKTSLGDAAKALAAEE